MKKFLLVCMMAVSVAGQITAQVAKTVNVENAGTLDQLIGEDEKYTITDLTVTGNLNGKDFIFLRDMAGVTAISTATEGKMTTLDLSGANIVASDDVYFSYANKNYTTRDNVLGDYIFLYAKKLQHLTLPANTEEIASQALAGCESVTDFVIPQSVKTIGIGAFLQCNSIKTLDVPDAVTTLGMGAFQRMDNLEEIRLGDGITELDNSIFVMDNNLRYIRMGKSVTDFDMVVLYTLPGLATIEVDEENETYATVDGVLFSKDLTTLMSYPCAREAESYDVPETVTTIGDMAFQMVSTLSVVNVPSNVETLGYDCFAASSISEFNLSEGLQYISSEAFAALELCPAIHIPASVQMIEPGAFSISYGLQEVNVDENNEVYASRDGILYDKELSTLLEYPSGKGEPEYITESGVVAIGDLAFYGNVFLNKLTLGEDISQIGMMAFMQAEGLREVYCMPRQLKAVDPYAFLTETLMFEGVLYVPEGTLDFYMAQPWVYSAEEETFLFSEVREMTSESISAPVISENGPTSFYDINGRRLPSLRKGLNIVRQGNRALKLIK